MTMSGIAKDVTNASLRWKDRLVSRRYSEEERAEWAELVPDDERELTVDFEETWGMSKGDDAPHFMVQLEGSARVEYPDYSLLARLEVQFQFAETHDIPDQALIDEFIRDEGLDYLVGFLRAGIHALSTSVGHRGMLAAMGLRQSAWESLQQGRENSAAE